MNNFFKSLFFVGKIAISTGIVLFLVPFIEPISFFSYFFLGVVSYSIVDLASEVWILVVRVNIIFEKQIFLNSSRIL